MECVQCKTEIPKGACQQGQKIDGVWYPLHVGCADIWASEKIKVYTILDDHGYITASIEDVCCHIENVEPGDSVEITVRQMERIKYLNLPEAE